MKQLDHRRNNQTLTRNWGKLNYTVYIADQLSLISLFLIGAFVRGLFIFLLVAVASLGYACPVGKTALSPKETRKLKKELAKLKAPRKPASFSAALMPILPTGESAQSFGGKNSHRAEAVLANSFAKWLNIGWQTANIEDVLVSIPVRMIPSANRVYGDGQTNAGVELGSGWNETEPQMAAMLLKLKNGDRKVAFWFSEKVNLNEVTLLVTSSRPNVKGQYVSQTEEMPIRNDAKLGRLAGWNVPSDLEFGGLTQSHLIWVQPKGWDAAFPIDFRMPIYSADQLSAGAGKSATTAGLNPYDPLKISERSRRNRELTELSLLKASYGPEWLVNLRNEVIHGEVNGNTTAVGGGNTWLVDVGAHSSFKNLYTCFDARNFEQEKKFGVPSGGGWHEIGDAAETIINNLESSPILVGYATGVPWPTPPMGLKFAWGLTDVATLRFLRPGEGQVTRAGDQTWNEDTGFRQCQASPSRGQGPAGGRNYHWFFFTGDTPVCTQEWVHNCRPTESDLGLAANCAEKRKICQ